MNKKYIKYIDYIVNDIETPFFINMIDHYGLKQEEYSLVLSKVFNQSVTIKGNSGYWVKYVYNTNGNRIYRETSNGSWYKREYDTNGNLLYYETSDGFWEKSEYNTNGNIIYYETSDGYWVKYKYDINGNLIYREDSNGRIEDNR